MVNANAQAILISTQDAMKKHKQGPVNVWASVRKLLKLILIGRIVITVLLIAWTLGISAMMVWKPLLEEEMDSTTGRLISDRNNYFRYYNLHKLWFGDEAVVMVLIRLWLYVLGMWLLEPILREVVAFVNLKI